MGPNFISPELVNINACVGQKTNKFEEEETQIGPTQTVEKHGAQLDL